ncbi:MAG TPA: hypothetical protein VD906_03085 [Caulobacteraceae bacterium]|nr:hypothetical protein [Caulobacteraceae bacterium]
MRRILLAGAAALALAACNPEQPQQAADPASFALLYAPATLQPAPQPVPVAYAPVPVAQQYWEDAYLMNYDTYNQPPAYFNYAGATPLVWTQQPVQQQSLGDTLTDTLTNMAITRIVEAITGGGTREYFYQPNVETPFFVRDPEYAYAYDDEGRLIALYDPTGAPLAQPLLVQQAPLAATYLMRADSLRDAALAATLQTLAPDVWEDQRVVLVRAIAEDEDEDVRAWRTWWEEPGDNRSPVAVQRLAEVRARKAARDAARAEWKEDKDQAKAEMKADRREDRGDNRAVAAGPKVKADKNDNPGNGNGNGDKAAKVEKRAEVKADKGSKGNGGGKPDKGAGGGNGKGNGGGKDKG